MIQNPIGLFLPTFSRLCLLNEVNVVDGYRQFASIHGCYSKNDLPLVDFEKSLSY